MLRVGVIGCGRMGERRGVTVARNPDTILIAVTDRDRSRADALASALGCVADDVDSLVRSPDIDTVFVCTPNRFHAEISTALMANGKHVICEKPLACTPADAAAMVEAAVASGVTIKVGANLRYFANVEKAHALLRSGQVGEPLSLRGWVGNNGWPTQSWFADPTLSGGGTVIDNGCHLFDLVRWFLGEVESCTGSISTLYWNVPVEDHGVGVFTTATGRLAVIHSSWTEWTTYFAFDLYGSEGVISVDNRLPAERTTLVRRDGTSQVFDFAGQRNDVYGLELAAYVQARRCGRSPEPTGADGVKVVEMVNAIYRSARLGRRVGVADWIGSG
jgi:predicted dehydrogenase